MAATKLLMARIGSPNPVHDWDSTNISDISSHGWTLLDYDNRNVFKHQEKLLWTVQDIRNVADQLSRRRPLPPNTRYDSNQPIDDRQLYRSSFNAGIFNDRALVRKRRGELEIPTARNEKKNHDGVRPELKEPTRPALRLYGGCWSSRMLSFSKKVCFNPRLEQICYFRDADYPSAVSARSNSDDDHDGDDEVLFSHVEYSSKPSSSCEWELITPNFPHDTMIRELMPVRLNKVYFSDDQTELLGSVVVANLAFDKSVSCRFSFDYWITVSETTAKYCHAIVSRENHCSDEFIFSIDLADTVDLELKPLFLCIQYIVNGQEFWDNNSCLNFQIDFKKK